MTPLHTVNRSMDNPPKRPLEERDGSEEPPEKVIKCCWCGQPKAFLDNKPYCERCMNKGKQCRRCHRPMSEDYYNLSSDYCRKCVKVKQTPPREKFAINGLVSRYELEPDNQNKFDLLTFLVTLILLLRILLNRILRNTKA